MNFNKELINLAQELVNLAIKNKIKIATAESCTGGLLSALITSISGSSNIFECGFVTYSNKSKNNLLKVDNKLLEDFGAVSKQVADGMAKSVINNANANLSISITGITGPNSDETNKEVGLVYISSFNKNTQNLISKKFNFTGKRNEVRNLSIQNAINILIGQIKNEF